MPPLLSQGVHLVSLSWDLASITHHEQLHLNSVIGLIQALGLTLAKKGLQFLAWLILIESKYQVVTLCADERCQTDEQSSNREIDL